jgi:hypothetical protein
MDKNTEPVVGNEYSFSRLMLGRTEQATFIRFADGGAVVIRNRSPTIWEHDNGGWKCALDNLQSEGYLMVGN